MFGGLFPVSRSWVSLPHPHPVFWMSPASEADLVDQSLAFQSEEVNSSPACPPPPCPVEAPATLQPCLGAPRLPHSVYTADCGKEGHAGPCVPGNRPGGEERGGGAGLRALCPPQVPTTPLLRASPGPASRWTLAASASEGHGLGLHAWVSMAELLPGDRLGHLCLCPDTGSAWPGPQGGLWEPDRPELPPCSPGQAL